MMILQFELEWWNILTNKQTWQNYRVKWNLKVSQHEASAKCKTSSTKQMGLSIGVHRWWHPQKHPQTVANSTFLRIHHGELYTSPSLTHPKLQSHHAKPRLPPLLWVSPTSQKGQPLPSWQCPRSNLWPLSVASGKFWRTHWIFNKTHNGKAAGFRKPRSAIPSIDSGGITWYSYCGSDNSSSWLIAKVPGWSPTVTIINKQMQILR